MSELITNINDHDNTRTREELHKKYFEGLEAIYNESLNVGIVSLLSDVQEIIARFVVDNSGKAEHYRELLNDVKAVLIQDEIDQRAKKGEK